MLQCSKKKSVLCLKAKDRARYYELMNACKRSRVLKQKHRKSDSKHSDIKAKHPSIFPRLSLSLSSLLVLTHCLSCKSPLSAAII